MSDSWVAAVQDQSDLPTAPAADTDPDRISTRGH